MTFSIIIPVFNRAIKLRRAINSAKQTERLAGVQLEIVVVDDASSDDSAGVALQAGADKVLRLQQNVGVTGARNHGIASAAGEFLIFLDSDDELQPDALVRITRHFAHFPDTDIMFGACIDRDATLMHRPDARIGRVTFEHFLVNSAPGEFLPVVHRRVFEALSFEEQLRGFEGITWLKAARAGFVLHYSDEILRTYDKGGEDRLCRRINMLNGSDRMSRGWYVFLCEFGADLWRLSKRAYLRALLRWALYERLSASSGEFLRELPPPRTIASLASATVVRTVFKLVPKRVWVRYLASQ